MEEVRLMGIVNRQVGVVDLFDGNEEGSSVALPDTLAVCADPERINAWALQTGLIRQGQCIAVPDH